LLERPVVVKRPKGSPDARHRQRFLTEARMLARLNHPNITQIYDVLFDQDEGRFYLVMEYVDGKDLAEIVQEGAPLPLDWVLDVAMGTLQALNYAHSQGVVHRDVKPDNIMIADEVKLTDFGLADLRSILEQGSPILAGTPAYMAPEQIEGRAVDGRADLYALGVILFELISGGRLPFENTGHFEMLDAHLSIDPPPVSQFAPSAPPLLEQIIRRLLAKDPEERYPSAQAVIEALGSIHIGRPPAFLEDLEERTSHDGPVFVARQRELARLDQYLAAAFEGHGQVVFVTGEAGRGKTTLLTEFARRAQKTRSELMVASGNCNAYSGVGDPYLPFRDVMDMLSGDVERAWAAGVITRDHARRLWGLVPFTAGALADQGPDLIDVFVSGSGLFKRATTAGFAAAAGSVDWVRQLQDLAKRERPVPGDLEQPQLFEQYTQVLRTLAAQRPLLLILDDLQWADTASINLLFHLGRRVGDSRILILGAYRPSEVALGRPFADRGQEEQHPLKPVINEFRRLFGDTQLDLRQATPAEDRDFVDVLLDTEPNCLDEAFRQALFRHTQGQPLFTVELIREMQERGDLVHNEQGQWVARPSLAWDVLPARVEAVIEGRISRLEPTLREILSVASVEGEDFTVQVVARIQEMSERRLLRRLSQELEKRHRLVVEREELLVGRQRLPRFRFRHALFQQYLYTQLSLGERRLLHGEIATLLEELFAGRIHQITVRLAHHYTEAGEGEKAIDYLLQAGDRARDLYAHQEAIDHYRQALVFLKEAGEYERAARTLMKLGLTYHTAFQFRHARQAYQEGFTLWQRAAEQKLATPPLPAPHALRVNAVEPTTLDLSVADNTRSREVIGQLYSGLVALSPEMDVVPDVARSWEVSEGGRGYVFHLRDNVRWSDGRPVTAADFEFAWKRVLDPAVASPMAGLLYDIKGARAFHQGEGERDNVGVWALDEHTLMVELEGPTGYFLQLLANIICYPLPRHVLEAFGEATAANSAEPWTAVGKIVTNGPFQLAAWRRGESMVLTRNPNYHGRCRGNIQRVELSLRSEDWPTILDHYEADELDVVHLLLPVVDQARQRHPGEYISGPLLFTWYVAFNTSRPPFDNPSVRRAFVLATNLEAGLELILSGYEAPATGGFVPPGMPGHVPAIGLPYDPEGAQQLLVEAGYPKGHGLPPLELLLPQDWEAVAKYLAVQWRETLGVEISWETLGFAARLDKVDRDPPPLFVAGWSADYPDPDNFLRASSLWTHTRWWSEAYHKQVEEARRLMDQGKRITLYRQADRLLIEDAVLMPLCYGRVHILVKPWVRNLPIAALEGWFWKDVIIDPH
jgi:ABC-type oligopeptide transport system substrate-binding subunit